MWFFINFKKYVIFYFQFLWPVNFTISKGILVFNYILRGINTAIKVSIVFFLNGHLHDAPIHGGD